MVNVIFSSEDDSEASTVFPVSAADVASADWEGESGAEDEQPDTANTAHKRVVVANTNFFILLLLCLTLVIIRIIILCVFILYLDKGIVN